MYQVDSSAWAHADNRWDRDDLPPEIRAKVAELAETGKPGAFVQLFQGEAGVYVICEKNIKGFPEAADDDLVLAPGSGAGSKKALSPYDIVVCTKDGSIGAAGSAPAATQEGDYYVIPYQTWGRFILEQPIRPAFIETTKEFLLLLDELHGKNFLSMRPDKESESLPADGLPPTPVIIALNCYVLNLARFKR